MVRVSDQVTAEMGAIANHLRQITVQVQGARTGSGSGVIWRSDGWIVTNAHVVRGQEAMVELFDGRVFQAAVTTRDTSRDLAVLQIQETDLPAATCGKTNGLRVGELVLAMGHPLGTVNVLTQGIIHALPTDSTDYFRWVQADIRLAPGNSGGPLVTAQGQVIGINSLIVEGRAFAIPSEAVQQLLQNPSSCPRLGVTLQPILASSAEVTAA